MHRSLRRARRAWPLLAALTVAAAIPAGVSAVSSNAAPTGPVGAVTAATRVGHVGAGRRVQLHPSATPFTPTQTQLAARARALAGLAKHVAPSMGRHTDEASVSGAGGPQTNAGAAPAAPTDFSVDKASLIKPPCAGCSQSQSNSPSVANDGRFIVEASNDNIAWTNQGGSTPIVWKSVDPKAIYPGFCCDQEVTYDASRNIFLLVQLDYTAEGSSANGLTVSVASGSAPSTWCSFHFAGAIGGGATDTPDQPKIAVANNNAYITWDDFPPNAGFARAGIARFPLDSLAACTSFSYNYLTRTTEFSYALTTGSAQDVFYWVSNWFMDGTTNGSNLRIFSWPDNSGSYSATTRAINAFNFSTVGCGGTPDWCSNLDPRYESAVVTRAEYRAQANSAFAGDTILEVAGTAGPSSFSDGNNYVVYNYFKLNSLAYIGNDETFSTSSSYAYPGCAVNVHGYVGCAMEEGTTSPGGFVLLQDATNPTQPWSYTYPVIGTHPAAAGGSYVVTTPFFPAVGPFQTVVWKVTAKGAVQPYYVVWGRASETGAWKRWKSN